MKLARYSALQNVALCLLAVFTILSLSGFAILPVFAQSNKLNPDNLEKEAYRTWGSMHKSSKSSVEKESSRKIVSSRVIVRVYR